MIDCLLFDYFFTLHVFIPNKVYKGQKFINEVNTNTPDTTNKMMDQGTGTISR